jgi:hypothetical protein
MVGRLIVCHIKERWNAQRPQRIAEKSVTGGGFSDREASPGQYDFRSELIVTRGVSFQFGVRIRGRSPCTRHARYGGFARPKVCSCRLFQRRCKSRLNRAESNEFIREPTWRRLSVRFNYGRGIKEIGKTTKALRVKTAASKIGVKVTNTYSTLGEYDVVDF